MSESKPTPRETSVLVTYTQAGGQEAREFGVAVRALEEADRVRALRLRATFAGVPWEHLDPESRNLFALMADAAVAVTRPDELPDFLRPWPQALLDHPAIAIQLGVFVGGHTERYFRDLARARGVDAVAAAVQVRPLARPGGV